MWSFMWVCWLSPKPFALSRITTNHVTGECYATPCSSDLPEHPLPQGSAVCLVWDCGLGPSRPWEHSSGSVQQTQKIMTSLKKLNPVFSYVSSPFPSPHAQTLQDWHFFHTNFLLSFPEKPLTVPLYHSWGSKVQVQEAEGNESDRTQGNPCMVPAWPPLLALTERMLMSCHLPPHLEGRCGWSCARGIQPLLVESSRLCAVLWQGTALSHQSPCHLPVLSSYNPTLTTALITMRCEKSHLLVQI